MHLYYSNTFFLFDFPITGGSASEHVLNIEDVIDLKEEPVEVSYIFSICARIITTITENGE